MLSQTSEHALRAVLYLAGRPARAKTSAEVVATALGAPRNYLAKTLNVLAKRGVLVSLRGPTGGFRLAAEPEAITLFQVVAPFEEPRADPICLLGDRPCTAQTPCTVHGRWTEVMEQVWAPLRTTTVAALLNDPDGFLEFAGNGRRHSASAAHVAEGHSTTGRMS
jgi:Rrf2 family transcriptional regulator, iron-sulfur cluster assembly transcription factor